MAEETPTFRIAPAIAALVTRIEGYTWLKNLPLITEDKGNIENDIQVALGPLTTEGGKTGACIVILAPRARLPEGNAPGPTIDPQFVLAVIENVSINQGDTGHKKSALQIVELLMRRIHRHHSTACNSAFLCDDPPYRLVESDPLTYEVYFRAKLALKPEHT